MEYWTAEERPEKSKDWLYPFLKKGKNRARAVEDEEEASELSEEEEQPEKIRRSKRKKKSSIRRE